jgi:tetratricopeptide (TPR) repeat protein
VLGGVLGWAERLRLPRVVGVARRTLALTHLALGDLPRARDLAEKALEDLRTLGDPRLEGVARRALAVVAIEQGDLDVGEAEATRAAALLVAAPPRRAAAIAARARVLLLRGRIDEAVTVATEALDLATGIGCVDEGDAAIRLVHADALGAAGRHADRDQALVAARTLIFSRAERITDERTRRAFVERLPDHARTLSAASAT